MESLESMGERRIFFSHHAEYRFRERSYACGKSLREVWEESHEVFVNSHLITGRVFYNNECDILLVLKENEVVTVLYADVMDEEDILCSHQNPYKSCSSCYREGQYLNTHTPKP